MKQLFFFALPFLLFSCKGAEQHKAAIEELAGQWDSTTQVVTNFAGTVSTDLTNYTQALAGTTLDEATAKKLKPEQLEAFGNAQKAVTDALGAYPAFQQTINDFVTTWTEKSAVLTELKDGLAAGKLPADATTKIADLQGMVTTAQDNLKNWQDSYGAIKGGVDSAMGQLTELMNSFATSK